MVDYHVIIDVIDMKLMIQKPCDPQEVLYRVLKSSEKSALMYQSPSLKGRERPEPQFKDALNILFVPCEKEGMLTFTEMLLIPDSGFFRSTLQKVSVSQHFL